MKILRALADRPDSVGTAVEWAIEGARANMERRQRIAPVALAYGPEGEAPLIASAEPEDAWRHEIRFFFETTVADGASILVFVSEGALWSGDSRQLDEYIDGNAVRPPGGTDVVIVVGATRNEKIMRIFGVNARDGRRTIGDEMRSMEADIDNWLVDGLPWKRTN